MIQAQLLLYARLGMDDIQVVLLARDCKNGVAIAFSSGRPSEGLELGIETKEPDNPLINYWQYQQYEREVNCWRIYLF